MSRSVASSYTIPRPFDTRLRVSSPRIHSWDHTGGDWHYARNNADNHPSFSFSPSPFSSTFPSNVPAIKIGRVDRRRFSNSCGFVSWAMANNSWCESSRVGTCTPSCFALLMHVYGRWRPDRRELRLSRCLLLLLLLLLARCVRSESRWKYVIRGSRTILHSVAGCNETLPYVKTMPLRHSWDAFASTLPRLHATYTYPMNYLVPNGGC